MMRSRRLDMRLFGLGTGLVLVGRIDWADVASEIASSDFIHGWAVSWPACAAGDVRVGVARPEMIETPIAQPFDGIPVLLVVSK